MKTRYLVCSKERLPTTKSLDSLVIGSADRKRRNTNFKRFGCEACFKIHFMKEQNGYEFYKFIEWHNHVLLMLMRCGFLDPTVILVI